MAMSNDINRRFFESIRDEPTKLLAPISGYEKLDVKSLNDACEPIAHLFDEEFKSNIGLAKIHSTAPENGLTSDESAAIYLYTLEWNIHEDSLYVLLNRTLCLSDRTKLHPWFKYLKLFLRALFKLPSSKHRLLWRAVHEDLHDLYPKDREFAWWRLNSCYSSMETLESSDHWDKSTSRTIFSIETDSGKDIRAHSSFDNDEEILLPPGLYFRVIDYQNPTNDLHIIHIREIPPPYRLLAAPFDPSELKEALMAIQSSVQVTWVKKESDPPVVKKPILRSYRELPRVHICTSLS